MNLPLTATYALRSLARHARRSLLAVIGIGVGCAIGLFLIAWVRGERLMMMQAAALSGTGHLCIVPAEWPATRSTDLRLSDWEPLLARLRQRHPEILTAMPRARTDALLAFGTRVAAVQMVGVDPVAEPPGDRLVQTIAEGRYLEPGETGKTVVGKAIADRLRVGVGDDLLVTVAGQDGQIAGAMLRIVGVVTTGSRDLDATICQVNLPDVAKLTGRPGAGEIAIVLRTPKRLGQVLPAIRSELTGGKAVALSWDELRPELAAGVKVDQTWARLIVGIIMAVVFLGIASAQLAAVLERRKEFAVLASLGMPGGKLIRVMLAEGLMLGLAGSLAGLVIGLPITGYVAAYGIDFTRFMKDGDYSMSDVLIDPIFRGDFGWWLVPLAFALALSATLLSSLYPAWYATRTNPATALRVDH